MIEKVGQLIVQAFPATRVFSTDSETFDGLAMLVRNYHVGGFQLSGGGEPGPALLLNPSYGRVNEFAQPLVAAILNRLQSLATIPLLVSADYEAGVGMRIEGATAFPRQMALGATGDTRLVREAAQTTAVEARALGVQVVFAPVSDVNNNPRNPVINTRSFGEDVDAHAELTIRAQ